MSSKKRKSASTLRKREEQKRAELAKKNKRKIIVIISLLAAAAIIVGIVLGIALNSKKEYYADIKVKGYGTITVYLDGKTAPVTVDNFVDLANDGFYDGLTFHRIVENFMIQGGDPDANGTGGNTDKNGNKITIKGEFSANGHKNDISHERGVISMARGNDYDSASSQFFICNADSPHLDGDYAAFGWVVDGIDVVDKITEDTVKYTVDGVIYNKANQAVIESITIRDVEK